MPSNSQLNIQSNTPKDHTQDFLDTLVTYIDKTHNPTVEFSIKPRKETDNKRKSLTDTKNEIKKYRNRTRNSDTQNRNNEIQHRTSDIQNRTSDIQNRTSDIQRRTRNSDIQSRNSEKQIRNLDKLCRTNDIQSRTSDIENMRNHSYTAINCQEKRVNEIHPISVQNPILETETYKLDKNNELLNYLRQKASKNTIYDKSNIQTNSPRKDTITLKAFVTEYCRNNDLERPEYLIEKQNDVYICKADFVGLSFSSKYHFEKQNAMEEVCKIIVDYLMENKERKKKKVMLKDLLA